MKRSLLLVFFLAITTIGNAQSLVAKLKFEDAEEAYSKKEYKLSLAKLNEAEALLGATNPRIMYLRIMTQWKMINDNSDTRTALSLIDDTKKLSAQYLKDYEMIPNNEDKFRDIYKISEQLPTYAATLKEREVSRRLEEDARITREAKVRQDAEKAAAAQKAEDARNELKRVAEAKLLTIMNKRIDSVAASYGFKWNMSIQELQKVDRDVKGFMNSRNYMSEGKYVRKFAGLGNNYTDGPYNLTLADDIVTEYSFYTRGNRGKDDENAQFIKQKEAEMRLLFPGRVEIGANEMVIVQLKEKSKVLKFYKWGIGNASTIMIWFSNTNTDFQLNIRY